MTDTTEKLDLERIADIAPFPWTFIGNSWQYTTIYDANDETLFTLNLEEWGVTEDNQYDLEECQGALARFIIEAANALACQNPTQDELTEQYDKAALLSKVSEMKEALDLLKRWHGVVASHVSSFDLPENLVADLAVLGTTSRMIEMAVWQKAEAALASIPTGGGWQDIETAPKDCTARLVWCPDSRCTFAVTWWQDDNEDGHWAVFGHGATPLHDRPTHWMPLPNPPLSTGEGK